MDKRDLAFRFLFGGAAVVLSYVASHILPWKIIGGIFAAFPAVMIVAVMMAGLKNGSVQAAQIAQGSVYGMIGCSLCVMAVLIVLEFSQNWWLAIFSGLISWFLGALSISHLREKARQHQKNKSTAKAA